MRLLILSLFIFNSFTGTAQDYYLFAGTYTSTGSKGIYVYDFNTKTGKATFINQTDSVTNPSFLVLSRNAKFLYAVNETDGSDPGKVSAFSFDKKDGSIKFINTQLSGGDDPCHLSISNDEKWIAVANYTGGSVSVFPVNKDGSLQPFSQLIQDSGSSVNKERQEKAHVHEAVFSRDNKYLYTPDLGADKVMSYTFNTQLEKPLQQASPAFIEITPGNGPRHITFHPNNKFAYLISELSGSVAGYRYNNGKFTQIQQIKTHPQKFKGKIGSAEIAVSPDGKFLYASNRGDENTITIFSINSLTGLLKLQGYQSTSGKAPRNFIIDPSGNYLIAANQDSDNIVFFKINKQTGLLKEIGEQIKVPKPVCLQMVKRNK